MIRRSILLACICAITTSWVSGQENPGSPNQIELIRNRFESATGSDRLFMNGSIYQDAYPRAQGHPFLGNGSWSEGSLTTAGKTFKGLLLKYDLCKDLLIYNYIHETGIYAVSLNVDRIDQFVLSGHRFVHVRMDSAVHLGSTSIQSAESGFYEELCRGKATLYAKWYKRYDPPSSGGNGGFMPLKYVYILNHGALFRVSGRKGVLKALADQEKLMKRYIREAQVALRGDDERGFQQLVEYYNSLQP